MSNTTYTTRDEAIYREIVEPIEAGLGAGELQGDTAHEAFDIDAIAAEVIESVTEPIEVGSASGTAHGYRCKVDPDRFWQIVERHQRPEHDLYLWDEDADSIKGSAFDLDPDDGPRHNPETYLIQWDVDGETREVTANADGEVIVEGRKVAQWVERSR